MSKSTTKVVWLVVVCVVFGVTTATAADQGWLNNSFKLGIHDNIDIKITQEARYPETTYHGDPFLKNLQAGVFYKFPVNIYGGVAYKRETETKSSFISQENRITLETGWKTQVVRTLAFDARLRIEFRNFELSSQEDFERYRLRVRFTYKTKLGNLAVAPFVATEPFGDTSESTDDFLNRNRFYLGTNIPAGKRVSFVINYMRQDTTGKETIHALNTGIDVKI